MSIENIVHSPVIKSGVAQMNKSSYKAIIGYMSALAQARNLMLAGLISSDEYRVIETKMCERFGIKSCSLFREDDWIYTRFRGNMSAEKEARSCQKS